MQRLFTSELLIVIPALTTLVESLNVEITLIAELNAKFFPLGVLDELPKEIDGEELIDTDSSCVPPDPRAWKTFSDVDKALRDCELIPQADHILELYGNSCGNASQTHEYVKALLVELELELVKEEKTGVQPDGPMEPLLFCYNERVYGRPSEDKKKPILQSKPWHLLNELWHVTGRSLEVVVLIEAVWEQLGPRKPREDGTLPTADNAFRGAMNKANRFFQGHKLPFLVKTHDRGRIVTLESTPS